MKRHIIDRMKHARSCDEEDPALAAAMAAAAAAARQPPSLYDAYNQPPSPPQPPLYQGTQASLNMMSLAASMQHSMGGQHQQQQGGGGCVPSCFLRPSFDGTRVVAGNGGIAPLSLYGNSNAGGFVPPPSLAEGGAGAQQQGTFMSSSRNDQLQALSGMLSRQNALQQYYNQQPYASMAGAPSPAKRSCLGVPPRATSFQQVASIQPRDYQGVSRFDAQVRTNQHGGTTGTRTPSSSAGGGGAAAASTSRSGVETTTISPSMRSTAASLLGASSGVVGATSVGGGAAAAASSHRDFTTGRGGMAGVTISSPTAPSGNNKYNAMRTSAGGSPMSAQTSNSARSSAPSSIIKPAVAGYGPSMKNLDKKRGLGSDHGGSVTSSPTSSSDSDDNASPPPPPPPPLFVGGGGSPREDINHDGGSPPSASSSGSLRKKNEGAPGDIIAEVDSSGMKLFVTEDLKNKSLQELAQKDIMGETPILEETVDVVEDCLRRFDAHLQSTKRKPAFDKALFLSPRYVKDRNFRLMFLRADKFDVAKSVKRFVAHFESKQDLFVTSSEKLPLLGRDITWDDLTEEDREAYWDGAFQVFNSDKSGRGIVCNIFSLHTPDKRSDQSRLRVAWYVYMCALRDDVESQKRGFIMMAYTLDTSPADLYRIAVMQAQSKFMDVLPVRFAALHCCFDNSGLLSTLMTVLNSVVDQSMILRFRSHVGSHLECQYSLASYGIQGISILPNGELDKESLRRRHHALIEREKTQIEMQRMRDGDQIACPGHLDVLSGKGHRVVSYPGNVILGKYIKNNLEMYRTSNDKIRKTTISSQIVREIQQTGGRFLKRSDDGMMWCEVMDDEISREKVSMGFRNASRQKPNKEKGNNNSSSSPKTTKAKTVKKKASTKKRRGSGAMALSSSSSQPKK